MELAGRIAHKCRLLDSQHKLLFFDHAHIVQKLWSAFLVLFYLLGVPLILVSFFNDWNSPWPTFSCGLKPVRRSCPGSRIKNDMLPYAHQDDLSDKVSSYECLFNLLLILTFQRLLALHHPQVSSNAVIYFFFDQSSFMLT